MMNPKRMYNLFVGNKNNHILYEKVWKRNFFPITINSILKHMRYDMAIGSYPIYCESGIAYCKWLCIDVDSHARIPGEYRREIKETHEPDVARGILAKLEKEYKKRVDKGTKALQGAFVRLLYDHLHELLWIHNDHVVVEDSVGGYHIWFFLKDRTTLEDVGKLVYCIRPIIDGLYTDTLGENADMPEYYPKQYTTTHLNKTMGNAVRLPLGYNFGKEGASEIIAGDLETVEKLDIHPLIKNVNIEGGLESMNKINCTRLIPLVFDAQDTDEILDFYLEFPIRDCFRMLIDGRTQCRDEHGHFMRMALVHELRSIKMPPDIMVYAFRKQDDFNEELTRIGVESTISSSKRKDGRYSCDKIRSLGYCHNCNYDRNKIQK